jgi:hypothetical protein
MIAVLAATRDLLMSLDPLPYRQRMNHLAAWARVVGALTSGTSPWSPPW